MTKHTFKFIAKSQNSKTGDIPQVYTDASSCAENCSCKDECYAKRGFCAIHWKNTNLTLEELGEKVAELNGKQVLIRHNVAGDMCKPNTDELDQELVTTLAKIYKEQKAYTYTHSEINEYNASILKSVQDTFTVNWSCETLDQVKKAIAYGVPAVIVVAKMTPKETVVDGIKLVRCNGGKVLKDKNGNPILDKNGKEITLTCKDCRQCANAKRDYAICFEAHGNGKKQLQTHTITID